MIELEVHGIRLEIAGFSEQGPRPENQDAFVVDRFGETSLVAVADGMGGEKGGRLAADTALDAVAGGAPILNVEQARRAVREADDRVTRAADESPDLHGGMGCALGILSLVGGPDGPGWIAAHVGDVRILSRSPDGVLRLETRDHTPAFGRWEAGEISLDEIPDSTGANRLQRAVGRGGEADVVRLPAAPGWSWLIISDGVYKAMRLDEIGRAMAAPTTDAACDAIRRKVEERGPDDNFTAVLVRARGPGDTAPLALTRDDAMTIDGTPSRPPRSAAAGIAAALGILALVVSAAAFWMAREASVQGAERTEVERLRMEVDSLRSVLGELIDPFGPSEPAVTPGTGSPAPIPGGGPATAPSAPAPAPGANPTIQGPGR